jgi:regulation of enolase protein 1 (concanavalin A-like superfamily)
MNLTNPALTVIISAAVLVAVAAAPAAESTVSFDRHDVLYRSHEYLRTAQYLLGKERDVIATWGWRVLEFGVGEGSLYREVVPEDKDWRFSNGVTAFDIEGDGDEELVVGRYRREKPVTQDIVWYERPADKKAPWIMHLIGTVPGTDMPHDIQPITIPLADGASLRGVVVSIHRQALCLFEPGPDPRAPGRKHVIGEIPEPPQSGMAIGDLNGDGRPDIVTGMFWIETPADPRDGTWKFRRYGEWDKIDRKWGSMNKLVVADFDGDGQSDLAVNEAEIPGSRLTIFKRDPAQPDGLWTSRTIDTGLYSPHSLSAADLDEDGRPDLILGEMEAGGYRVPLKVNPRIYAYLNRDGGRFDRVMLGEGTGLHEAKIAPRRFHGKLAYYSNSTTQPWLDGMISHLSLWTVMPAPANQLLRDDFDEGFAAGWTWLREDSNGWINREFGLKIRALPGTLWGRQNDAKNLLLRPAPAGDFAAEVTLDNAPGVPSEQAGLLLYGGDNDYIKLVKEMVKDGSVRVVFAREEGGKAKVVREVPFTTGTEVVLRLTSAGGKVRAQFRRPTEKAWQDVAECAPVPAPELRVGLAAHVTGVSDRLARFTRFELSEVAASGENNAR